MALLLFISNALAQTAPTVVTQPSSQTVIIGSNVMFWVTVTDGPAPPLPSVSSGTLQLWLKADTGVVASSSGLVSQWDDQSGGTNNASQSDTNEEPLLVYPPGLGGKPAVQFNGIQDNVHGSYMQGAGLVNIPAAMTAFTVYNAVSTANPKNAVWSIGVPDDYGGDRCFSIVDGQLNFSDFAIDFLTSWDVPANTCRVCTDRVNASLSRVEFFDNAVNNSTNFTEAMTGASAPSAGYYLGGLNPAMAAGAVVNFDGDIAEVIIYQGYLSDADRLAVLGYLQQKYNLSDVNSSVSYQWQFDSANIPGATNATLTLPDVQTNQAGSYSVVVTNRAGSATSSNAVLVVNPPPPCFPAPSGIVGWWPANGTTVDIVGGDNGTLEYGATFGPGEVGQAFSFNGDNQFVEIPATPALEPQSVTLECWFNDSNPASGGNLISKPVGSGDLDSYQIWLENGNLNGLVCNAGTEGPILSYAFTPSSGVWYHAAYTFDSGTRSQTLYLNGSEVASGTANLQIGYDANAVLIGIDSDNDSGVLPFTGSIDEVSIYNRALTATEIAGIYNAGDEGKCGLPANILAQPLSAALDLGSNATFSVTVGGTPPLAYQWSFNRANIEGATNAMLELTNVGFSAAGSYAVFVKNALGSATSSNAVLVVGNPPSITIEPTSRVVAQGARASFTVTASGTSPLTYQWSFEGTVVAQATNSTLTISDAQPINSGAYSVVVSSPFGSVLSSDAVLTIDLLPVILNQPQSQTAVVGSNVAFSVTATAEPLLPAVDSGTLQLWLKADAGVITNSAGEVSQWQDQSGNTNHADQANTAQQPLLVSALVFGGRAAVQFNGIQNNNNGSYLQGTGLVGVPAAMTAFTVYNAFSAANNENVFWFIGVPGISGAGRGAMITGGDLHFTFWAYDFSAPFVVPTDTYRIRTDRLDANLDTIDMFDATADSATNFTMPVTGAITPGAGYYLGGLDASIPNVGGSRNFDGTIAELICYQGYLSEADRLAVTSYLQQKYFEDISSASLSYQWRFDGTNIAGATNSTLTLTNLQGTESGSYSVVVTSPAGSVTSSNAMLTPLFPPTFTSSPANQSVVAGTTVTFSAAATGTAPITYQWQFAGANIPGATNTSLTLTNVLVANAGSYLIVATSPYGSATSAVAVLTVDESTVQAVSTSAVGDSTVVVSIDLNAVGTESAVGFSLDFDPSVLTFSGVVLGSGAAGAALLVNSNQAASGVIGLGVDLFSGTFSPGTNNVFDVTFLTAPVTNATTTALSFGNQPTEELVAGAQAQTLPSVFLPGIIAISRVPLEGDVSPRPNGDEVLNIADWVQEARFVAGLDTVSNGSEFQRADCAPRATLGDGQITVADWVQVGRYAVGLDPLTVAGGPTSPLPQMENPGPPVKTDFSSILLVPLSQGSLTNSVAVDLVAQGDENALSFSITFDPTMVQFAKASLGSGAPGAAFVQNTNLAASGNVGFLVGLVPPSTFEAGTQQVVEVQFASVNYSNIAALTFCNTPIPEGLADANANTLMANFQNATLAVGGSPWPTLEIAQFGSNVVLSWPSTATGFGLQEASAPGGSWTNVLAAPAAIGTSLVVTSSIATNSQFFRLQY
jgi:hypothetical protein